jgi:hypothetical protein
VDGPGSSRTDSGASSSRSTSSRRTSTCALAEDLARPDDRSVLEAKARGATTREALVSYPTEGFNNKARITTRKAYGFRTYEHAEIALYHALGDLPEPDGLTHKFC